MNKNESFRTHVQTKLAEILDLETLRRSMRVIDEVINGYEITAKCTDLITANEMPDLVRSFIASKAVENKARGTLTGYTEVLAHFFQAVRKPLPDIVTNDIRLYMYKYREMRKVSDSRIEYIRVVLNNFFEWCTLEGELDRNPAKRIAVIKTARKERHPMSLRDLEKIRVACADSREKALVDFLFSTGCRISEVSNVKLEDINLDDGTVLIRHGKGDKERTVYINAESAISIQRYLNERKGTSDYLFISQKCPFGKLKIRALEKIITGIVQRTDLKIKVTPHVFRHTSATVAIRHGMPVEQVQRMLGHESLDTTMVYARTDDSQVKLSHERCVS